VTLARCNNCCLSIVNFAGSAANSLESLYDIEGGLVSNLAKDDVLAIEPTSNDSCDEELRTVAVEINY